MITKTQKKDFRQLQKDGRPIKTKNVNKKVVQADH